MKTLQERSRHCVVKQQNHSETAKAPQVKKIPDRSLKTNKNDPALICYMIGKVHKYHRINLSYYSTFVLFHNRFKKTGRYFKNSHLCARISGLLMDHREVTSIKGRNNNPIQADGSRTRLIIVSK